MRARVAAAAVAAAACLLAGGRPVEACAPAPRFGERVEMASEEAIIVWDAAHGVEHFVRRADFDTASSDFGFLVPTPTQPQLAEARGEAFLDLALLLQPRWETRTEWALSPSCVLWGLGLFMLRSGAKSGGAPPVRVLDAAHVAGYDAVVLEADSPAALGEWLSAHGYEWRDALKRWAAPYVAAKWKITAFKIARAGAQPGHVGSAAVRMSFTTDRPVYPYREPDDVAPPSGRSLRVAFVGPERVTGVLGAARTPWNAGVAWAGPLPGASKALAGVVEASAVPAGAWLTYFEDPSVRRPGEGADLFFERAPDQSPVEPPPLVDWDRVEIPFPTEPLLVVGFALWLRRRGRKRREGR